MNFEISNVDDLKFLCDTATPESLNLEFKEKENSNTPEISKTDKRNIAQTVSSFANSEGGILIFGVRTFKKDGVDVAGELKPIANVESFARHFEAVCAFNISPDLTSIDIRAIDAEDGNGFVICTVGRSDRRPHMSTAPGVHTYYRRSFEGSVPMAPNEVRDQILAIRDAILEPDISLDSGGSYSPNYFGTIGRRGLNFAIRNSGNAACKSPFLRVKSSCPLHSFGNYFDSAFSGWKTNFEPGTLIHVEDRLICFSLSFNFFVDFGELNTLFVSNNYLLTPAVKVFPGTEDYHVDHRQGQASLDSIDLTLIVGAENSVATRHEVCISRKDVARAILSNSTVQEQAAKSIGAFRLDLLAKFLDPA